jgi:ATP-dependent Clp protease adaptor protein ClpS
MFKPEAQAKDPTPVPSLALQAFTYLARRHSSLRRPGNIMSCVPLAYRRRPSVSEHEEQTDKKKRPKRQPRYNVILWNDDDHSYEYVVEMMKDLFGHPETKGFKIAKEVDKTGKAICLTTTLEHAELKRDQIHAFGADKLIARCKGSMSATIEPVEG